VSNIKYQSIDCACPITIKAFPLLINDSIIPASMHDENENSSKLLAKDIGFVPSKEKIEDMIKILESISVENKNV
jgi:hypothetical protein